MGDSPSTVPVVRFAVVGDPVAKGSHKLAYNKDGSLRLDRHGNPILLDDSPELKSWCASIGYACNLVWKNRAPLDEPVLVDLEFFLKPPSVKRSWTRFKPVKPDEDKLRRAVLDGLHIQGSILLEDSRVVGGSTLKRTVGPSEKTGVVIEIVCLGEFERAGWDVVYRREYVQRPRVPSPIGRP